MRRLSRQRGLCIFPNQEEESAKPSRQANGFPRFTENIPILQLKLWSKTRILTSRATGHWRWNFIRSTFQFESANNDKTGEPECVGGKQNCEPSSFFKKSTDILVMMVLKPVWLDFGFDKESLVHSTHLAVPFVPDFAFGEGSTMSRLVAAFENSVCSTELKSEQHFHRVFGNW